MTGFLDWFDRHKTGIIGSLMLHTTVLFYFAFQDLRSEPEEHERSELRVEVAPPISEEEFERIEQQIVTGQPVEVKALSSNVTAQYSAPRLSARTQERMAEAVEEDLRAMEQAEFDRLRAERAARGEDIEVPELDPTRWDPQRYEQQQNAPKPVRVEGVAMVEYDLQDRSDQYLHRPGFQCRSGGVVLIRVQVGADGRVQRAELDASASSTSDDCLVEKALGSARSARFNRSASAPDPQKGWIKYTFLSQ
ncbi:MAG: hypothetical protein JNL05_04035 [Flavobacteriales bacterium]|nr:hypothetical protein [Flavobacteriales bacterium]